MQVVHATDLRIQAAARRGRIATLRVGARAPPQSCVV
jgi:hypothetical protein